MHQQVRMSRLAPLERGSAQVSGEDVLVVAEEGELVLADLDGAAAELGDQDLVAGLDAGSDALAVAVKGAGADGEDLGLVELLDGRLGQEEAARGLGLGLDALHQDAVEQRRNGADGLEGGLVRLC
jgi:hypothetical protein